MPSKAGSVDVGEASDSEVASLIDRAEDAFSAGESARAQALLTEALQDPSATDAERAQALSDLAVIASVRGSPDGAEAYLLAALACDAGYAPALENLAEWCAATGDLVQATHWARRAAEADPGRPDGWARLASLMITRRRWLDARTALERAEALGHDVSAERDDFARNRLPASRPEGAIVAHPTRRVLIAVDYFHPSLGGSERLAEAAGAALQTPGIAVEIATRPLAQRTRREHRGMAIHEIGGDPIAGLRALVSERGYDAILVFSGPTSWPLIAALSLPAPRPRIVAVPCINAENSAALHSDPQLMGTYAALLGTADVVGYSSRSGPDVQLCDELGIGGVYVPNASERVAPSPAGSRLPKLGHAGPMLLMVSNMWPEKNHLGLLRTLRAHSGDWRLVIIGDVSTAAVQLAEDIRSLAAQDPRVHLLGPAPAAEVAAAMEAAQLLLLPSLAEATPLVLLEAMSRRLAWIATPTCGAAHDHAGGLILPLALFGAGIDFLLADDVARYRLGAAGLAHWHRSYTWDVVGPRYERLLRGEPVSDLQPPEDALSVTEAVRAEFYDRRPRGAVVRAGGRRRPSTVRD